MKTKVQLLLLIDYWCSSFAPSIVWFSCLVCFSCPNTCFHCERLWTQNLEMRNQLRYLLMMVSEQTHQWEIWPSWKLSSRKMAQPLLVNITVASQLYVGSMNSAKLTHTVSQEIPVKWVMVLELCCSWGEASLCRKVFLFLVYSG